MSTAVVSSNWRAGPGHVGDIGVQRSPFVFVPMAGGGGGFVTRSGSIGSARLPGLRRRAVALSNSDIGGGWWRDAHKTDAGIS